MLRTQLTEAKDTNRKNGKLCLKFSNIFGDSILVPESAMFSCWYLPTPWKQSTIPFWSFCLSEQDKEVCRLMMGTTGDSGRSGIRNWDYIRYLLKNDYCFSPILLTVIFVMQIFIKRITILKSCLCLE